MSKELVVIDDAKLVEYLDLFGFKNIPENEKKQFIEVCKMGGLNPFKREAHISAYGHGDSRQFAVITGYEVYIRRAEESGRLVGWKTSVNPCKTAKTDLQGNITFVDDLEAKIIIHRSDFEHPYEHSVKFSEYVQKKKDGTVTKFWLNAESQLKKVAISQGFRLCFNEVLKDLPHTREEWREDYMNITEIQDEKKQLPPKLNTPETIAKKDVFDDTHKSWDEAVNKMVGKTEVELKEAINKLKDKFEFSEESEKDFIGALVDIELQKQIENE